MSVQVWDSGPSRPRDPHPSWGWDDTRQNTWQDDGSARFGLGGEAWDLHGYRRVGTCYYGATLVLRRQRAFGKTGKVYWIDGEKETTWESWRSFVEAVRGRSHAWRMYAIERQAYEARQARDAKRAAQEANRGAAKCDPTCPGWEVFNETDYSLGDVQRCDACAYLAKIPMTDELAWEAARASGVNVDPEGSVVAPRRES